MLLSEEEKEEDHVDWYEPRITNFRYSLKEIELWKKEQIAQQRMEPQDSISNVSRKSAGSKVSSSAFSACKKAAAENAALLAKAAALKDKHALLMQETRLQTEMETMELNAEIAASVLENGCTVLHCFKKLWKTYIFKKHLWIKRIFKSPILHKQLSIQS